MFSEIFERLNTLAELKNALLDKNPLTIVITSNIDDCNSEVYDLRIESNKTIIGSYASNRLTDPRLRTDDTFKVLGVSNNIITKNLDIEVLSPLLDGSLWNPNFFNQG